jgi:hypothetical protein
MEKLVDEEPGERKTENEEEQREQRWLEQERAAILE